MRTFGPVQKNTYSSDYINNLSMKCSEKHVTNNYPIDNYSVYLKITDADLTYLTINAANSYFLNYLSLMDASVNYLKSSGENPTSSAILTTFTGSITAGSAIFNGNITLPSTYNAATVGMLGYVVDYSPIVTSITTVSTSLSPAIFNYYIFRDLPLGTYIVFANCYANILLDAELQIGLYYTDTNLIYNSSTPSSGQISSWLGRNINKFLYYQIHGIIQHDNSSKTWCINMVAYNNSSNVSANSNTRAKIIRIS